MIDIYTCPICDNQTSKDEFYEESHVRYCFKIHRVEATRINNYECYSITANKFDNKDIIRTTIQLPYGRDAIRIVQYYRHPLETHITNRYGNIILRFRKLLISDWKNMSNFKEKISTYLTFS